MNDPVEDHVPARHQIDHVAIRGGGTRLGIRWWRGAGERDLRLEQHWSDDDVQLAVVFEQFTGTVTAAAVRAYRELELTQPLNGRVIVDAAAAAVDRPPAIWNDIPAAKLARFLESLDWAILVTVRQLSNGRLGVTADTEHPGRLGKILRWEFGPGLDVSGELACLPTSDDTPADRLRWRRHGFSGMAP